MQAQGQQSKIYPTDTHTGINESQPGPKNNTVLDGQNPDSVWPPETDSGGQPPFKYSFSLAHKRIEGGGWTRQVTVRDLPISKTMAGVEMRLISGGIRELHWHVASEWALMLYGSARITAVDQHGRAFVERCECRRSVVVSGRDSALDPGPGAGWCKFLLVFKDGNFNEFGTFLLTDWLHHTPKEVLAKNFDVPESTFDNVPKRELFIFQRELPRPLAEEKQQVEAVTGAVPNTFASSGQDAADQSVQGRRGEDHRPQKLSRDRHRGGDRDAEAGRPAGAALASERGRVAVLREGQGPDDGVCGRWPGAHDGLSGGRCGIHRHVDAALHREHGRRGPGVYRGVSDAVLRGYFAGGVAGAYAFAAGG